MTQACLAALLIALHLMSESAWAQGTRNMAFVLGAEQQELAVDVRYQEPSDVDRRFTGSRLIPVELSVRNLSARPLPFGYADVRLSLNGDPSLSPVSNAAVLAEMRRLGRYTLLDRVIGANFDGFFRNFDPDIRAHLERERLRDGEITPGRAKKGFVYFLRPPESDGKTFDGVMWLEWPAAARYPPQMLETKAVRVKTKPEEQPSLVTRVLAAALGGKPPYNKSYALLVGIGRYRYLKPLSSPEVDVKKMEAFLFGQGFNEVVSVTDETVTKAMLRSPQNYFKAKIQGDDRFIFYYSGHGVSEPNGTVTTGWLPLVDEQPGHHDHSVPMNELVTWITGLSAKHLLVILDSCFSGLAVHGLEIKGEAPTVNQETLSRLSGGTARYLLMAGNEKEESIADRRWNGSLFTEEILTGLQTAPDVDMHRDRIITMRELYAWLPEAVHKEAVKVDRRLTPLLKDLSLNGASDGDFVFVR